MPTSVNPQECEALEASFGNRLRELRKALDLTQEAIAERLGVAVRTIKGYEAGSTTVASDVLYRMMAIGIDLSYLFYGEMGGARFVLPLRVDDVALDRAIAWVDGSWGENPGGDRISEKDRLAWILTAYASMVGGQGAEKATPIPESADSKRRKAG